MSSMLDRQRGTNALIGRIGLPVLATNALRS